MFRYIWQIFTCIAQNIDTDQIVAVRYSEHDLIPSGFQLSTIQAKTKNKQALCFVFLVIFLIQKYGN